ncbi:protein-glutamine gamma-glutamyltransferase 5-like [Stegastes partitus]|uniref:Protein-glutamine gamma-glutamyltransferase 5-like n=1 Tax=Stegastes partitus TaxID=144197 RepID=A0A9Y4NAI3_9TELE|nr:PREDICTED: protein-glutamine gamma-glutamyltransferase 5-like [Stegastes partitus]
MDCMQQAADDISGVHHGCRLKFVNFEAHENHISHETQGLSDKHLVVRRGKPFKLTLLFHSRSWNPRTENLVLEVCLGGLSERIPVLFSKERCKPKGWSATLYPGNTHPQSVIVHICSPVLCSVALYDLLLHIEAIRHRRSYVVGTFVLLYNPWLKDDPVHMPLDVHLEEYLRSDYGLIYMGTHLNVSKRPWSFGQYEPGVLEACLKLLQVSPQHLSDKHTDYMLRADPVYLSRVLCAMVNCNDDLGILEGKWNGSYQAGIKPTDWSGSADILHRWVSSNCSPVRYGQCWVFAAVLCTGERNFHVWVECWMRRPDLGAGFDGWQVVDPTPQERSAGLFRCGPSPVAAVQLRCFGAPHDTSFIYASVDADVIRLIVRDGRVVGRTVDTEWVGQLICTKSLGSDRPENLTQTYKGKKRGQPAGSGRSPVGGRCLERNVPLIVKPRSLHGETSPSLEVSLEIDGVPSLGESIRMSVTITNQSSSRRILMEHVDAQLKEYNSSPQESFWKTHKEVHMQPCEVLTLHHIIPHCDYESVLAGEDIVNVAVVIKDMRTKERVLAAQEFSISSPWITIEIEGGDSIQIKKQHTAQVSFSNLFISSLPGAVLTVEGSGLLQGKQEARLVLLQPGEKIEKTVSIMASSPGTKLLMATFSHSNSPHVVCRSFHRVSVTPASC